MRDAEPHRLLPDANLFVAAVRHRGRETDSLRLLARLAEDQRYELIGDRYLVEEYQRYALAFHSLTAAGLLSSVLEKMRVVRPHDRFIAACLPFLPAKELADLIHAAACLETGAALISNDRHFDRIASAGLIHRFTLSEAIEALL